MNTLCDNYTEHCKINVTCFFSLYSRINMHWQKKITCCRSAGPLSTQIVSKMLPATQPYVACRDIWNE